MRGERNVGEASASELNPEPIQDLKGDARAVCYVLVFGAIYNTFILRAERPEGEARRSIFSFLFLNLNIFPKDQNLYHYELIQIHFLYKMYR